MRSKGIPQGRPLETAIAKDFRGGWNTFDTALNLSSRYLPEVTNLYPDTNGRLRLRFGTSLFSDTAAQLDDIIGVEYYAGALVAVGANGKIVTINASGTVTVRWNTAIAAALPGAPAAWSTGLTFVSFTQFAGSLIICNGVDKPVTMNELYAVSYLQDAGTGSNANVPRAKYCCTHNDYLILAVTPTEDHTLHIGNKGSAGTFVGDPAPNDAVAFRCDTYINIGTPTITGLCSFRDKLIVSFNEVVLAVQLGTYNASSEHVPSVADTIDNLGAISHRCIVPLGDDVMFMDVIGVASVQRALITATLSPTRESTLISRDMQVALSKFSQTQLERYVYAVHDRVAQQLLFFVPKSTTVTATTDNDVFVYCFDKAQKLRAWTLYSNMPFRAGCRTTEGRVYLASGTEVFRYHNQAEPVFADNAIEDQQAWSDGTLFTDGTGWEEPGSLGGSPISYSFTLPWTDLKHPAKMKQSKYLLQTVEGESGEYTVFMDIDRYETASLQATFTSTIEPSASGLAERPSNNDQLYAWPQRFHRMRIRVEGTAYASTAFISLGLLYQVGGIRR
jgi:hypothetical protein